METIFVETKKKFSSSDVDLSLLDSLDGKTISLAATIQYIGLVPKVKEYLESLGKVVITKKGAYYDAHVLGCNSFAFDNSADTLLLISDGKFHAINNAIQVQRPIKVFTTRSMEEITLEEIGAHNKKTKGKQTKFLAAKKVGLLLSSKYGQKHRAIFSLKKRVESLGKKVYVFEADNISLSEFDNHKEIGMWVNTACYGLARDDMRIVNFHDIMQFLD